MIDKKTFQNGEIYIYLLSWGSVPAYMFVHIQLMHCFVPLYSKTSRFLVLKSIVVQDSKTDGVGPIDNTPSTD